MKRTAASPDTPRLTPEHLDEIRAGVDWQALFSGLGLRKAERKSRPNDWWAFSPFHDEKTPSFHMGPGGLWYDFSIGEGGGPIELVQQLQHCNCYEAARLILESGWSTASLQGKWAPVSRPEATPNKHARIETSPARRQSRSTRRRVENTVSPQESARETREIPGNPPIRQDLIPLCTGHALLEERGISDDTCDLLGIGYLPAGRSPMKGRIVFQVADARPGKTGELERVILSHVGRAVGGTWERPKGADAKARQTKNFDEQSPKYLFYEGFHKSAELYGQELLALHEDAAEQARATSHILLTEGPFDVAKAVQAGLRNVVGSFGASLSEIQAGKLRDCAERFGNSRILIAYDRDEAGNRGAEKAAALLKDHGLDPAIFDWDQPVGKGRRIPDTITDLGDLSAEQLHWLRGQGLL